MCSIHDNQGQNINIACSMYFEYVYCDIEVFVQ